MNRRELLLLGSGAFAAFTLPAYAAQQPVFAHGAAFGTSWKLTAVGDAQTVDALEADIVAIVERVDKLMSPFRAEGPLSRFNRTPDTDWQPMAEEICSVVSESLRVTTLTGEAFNPTVGPLVGRYGFGPITSGHIGRAEQITVSDGAVRKADPELTLDLCGIAKGYALDLIADAIGGRGIADCVVELGGEVFATGRHPSGRAWQIGVEGPAGFQHVIALDRISVATSGIAINAYAHEGRLYPHLINPATGLPAESELFSVTVAHERAAMADALATALHVMGPEGGPAFATDQRIEALFVMRDGSEHVTGGFDARFIG